MGPYCDTATQVLAEVMIQHLAFLLCWGFASAQSGACFSGEVHQPGACYPIPVIKPCHFRPEPTPGLVTCALFKNMSCCPNLVDAAVAPQLSARIERYGGLDSNCFRYYQPLPCLIPCDPNQTLYYNVTENTATRIRSFLVRLNATFAQEFYDACKPETTWVLPLHFSFFFLFFSHSISGCVRPTTVLVVLALVFSRDILNRVPIPSTLLTCYPLLPPFHSPAADLTRQWPWNSTLTVAQAFPTLSDFVYRLGTDWEAGTPSPAFFPNGSSPCSQAFPLPCLLDAFLRSGLFQSFYSQLTLFPGFEPSTIIPNVNYVIEEPGFNPQPGLSFSD
jgi:hypothetical protein